MDATLLLRLDSLGSTAVVIPAGIQISTQGPPLILMSKGP
jgi:hypothetical protein